MAAYGNIPAIKRMLAATGTVYDANHEARLTELNEAISRVFEGEVGRTYGAPLPDLARLVWATGGAHLMLPVPAWSVSSVWVGGDVTGDYMTGGSEMATGSWVVGIEDPNGQIYALMHASSSWSVGLPVNVIGQWCDYDRDVSVPPHIVTAINKLVCETFKGENVPIVTEDGVVVPRRDPWTDPFVSRVIQQERISARELVL